MRTVLVTGPGGSGRTTVAAATALAAARDGGGRVLLLSGDRLDGPLGVSPGPDPVEAEPGLWVAGIDPAEHFRAETLALQERLATGLDLLGARPLAAEEITELPGARQSALLHAVRRAAEGHWDTVVVDLPALPEALALLALPEQLRRYLRRLLPRERQAARALRPMMAQLAGIPMPAQWLYEAAARWDEGLAAVQALIEDPGTTVRLVAEPGPAAAEALRSARGALALYGLRADTVVANRVLPPDAGAWLTTLAAQQRKCLDEWSEEWPATHETRHLGRDPRGADDLALLGAAAVGAGADRAPWPVEDRLAEENLLVWCVPLPGAVKSELSLVRRDDELLLGVGPFHRAVPLPSALRRCTVTGAALTDGVLRVRFTPDPGLWPRTA
ncbi:ArsA family ATPase [Streptomyces corynorhini]|uniref:ArsA family ATPase n=1 Tax=Streptomyces corynorhini TaxID=2282652 RepID=A0A370BD23_9ACTN|nr:ArsA-related P-loop ATPase [Streptomyces corynorhini]RDG38134.1 ArsA family ATPase [Streptomyces corynorhini]